MDYSGWCRDWRGQNLPKTGQLIYLESWHDNYRKRILATEFDPYSGPMQDGKKVLDLCAFHPATANHIVTKLVRRMISDNPPQKIIQSTQALLGASIRSSAIVINFKTPSKISNYRT
jgi:uncharacterized protein (DUF1800 family)